MAGDAAAAQPAAATAPRRRAGARTATIALAVLGLAALVGYGGTHYWLRNHPAPPASSPVASAPSVSPAPTPIPSASTSPSPSPTASPSATASSTPSPSASPAAPARLAVTATASSSDAPHNASQAVDGNRKTYWQSGGKGEDWIELTLKQEAAITRIGMITGRVDKHGLLFRMHPRVKAVRLVFSNGDKVEGVFDDNDETQFIELEHPQRATSVRITVKETYRGRLGSRVAIPEVEVWGTPSHA